MAERKLAGHTQRNIRSSNLHVVLSMFRSSDTLTIRDITERTGLSKTAVSKIVNELLSRGLVLPAGKGTSTEGGGKRPDLFELSTKNTFAIAATFIPNLITVSLYDANLVLLDSERRQPSDCDPTPYFNCDLTTADQRQKTPQEHFEYDAAISVLAGLIQRIMVKNHLTPAQVAGITISVVGIVSSETGTLVTTLISKDWPDELPVVRDLRQHLPFPCSIYLDNISRVGAYAHLWEKPQRYQQNIVVLYCDNSVGGAYIRNGHLVHGKRGLVGEFGHITTDYTFKSQCACGKSGCFESIVARDAIESRVCRELDNWPESSLNACPDAPHVTIAELFQAADNGDPFACLQVDLVARQFSVMIYNFQIMYDPDEIIISAYCVPQIRYFTQSVKKQLYYFAGQTEMNLVLSSAGNEQFSAFLLNSGAAAFCLDQYYSNEALADLA